MLPQYGFDFPQFNPITANLYLIVHSSQKFNFPIRSLPDQIAGFIQARLALRTKWIADKFLGRQFLTIEVTPRQSQSANMQFPRDACRNRLNRGSETWNRVLAMGFPISGVSTLSTLVAPDQMVVSVGPYMFQSDSHFGKSCLTKSSDQASPPHKIFRSPLPRHPDSSNNCQVVGVACSTVTPCCTNCSANRFPSIAVSARPITTFAPTLKGSHNSSPAMSKESVVTASSVSALLSPGSRLMLVRKLTNARCGICTPLGWPVEPEV